MRHANHTVYLSQTNRPVLFSSRGEMGGEAAAVCELDASNHHEVEFGGSAGGGADSDHLAVGSDDHSLVVAEAGRSRL
jgi:hypothetical protein